MDVTGLATFKFLIFLMQCQPPVLVVRFFGSKCMLNFLLLKQKQTSCSIN